jgi:hypothetical protein
LVAFWEDVGLTFLAEVEAPFAEFFFLADSTWKSSSTDWFFF